MTLLAPHPLPLPIHLRRHYISGNVLSVHSVYSQAASNLVEDTRTISSHLSFKLQTLVSKQRIRRRRTIRPSPIIISFSYLLSTKRKPFVLRAEHITHFPPTKRPHSRELYSRWSSTVYVSVPAVEIYTKISTDIIFSQARWRKNVITNLREARKISFWFNCNLFIFSPQQKTDTSGDIIFCNSKLAIARSKIRHCVIFFLNKRLPWNRLKRISLLMIQCMCTFDHHHYDHILISEKFIDLFSSSIETHPRDISDRRGHIWRQRGRGGEKGRSKS